MNLEFGKAVEDIMDVNVVKELKQSPDSIIFGAGESGVWVVRWLRSQGIFPKCFCDNYVEKWMGGGGGQKRGYQSCLLIRLWKNIHGPLFV